MFDDLARRVIACRQCPRLVVHLADVAKKKKREFADWSYWAKPLPGFGDPRARLLVVGLAPAAHGGSRTGRMFTGDSSGAFLMRAMNKVGFASQPSSVSKDDGLTLVDAYISLGARCAPPQNKPTPLELASCRPYLVEELGLLQRLRVIVALGAIAFDAVWRAGRDAGWPVPDRRVEFGHGVEVSLGRVPVVASYHPSRQNTNTGKLTEAMFDRIFARARDLVTA